MKDLTKVLTALVIFSSAMVFGQFGVKGGAGVATTLSKDNDTNFGKEVFNYKPGFAFHVGAGYEIDISDMISVEPALLFAQRSFKADINDQLFTFKLSYVELPINAKVYVLELGDNQLYGLAGGYVGYMLTAKLDGEKIEIGNDNDEEVKPLDGGVNIGVGIQLFDSLNVDLSGSIGVANLSNVQTNGYKDNNRVFRLTVTYQFGG